MSPYTFLERSAAIRRLHAHNARLREKARIRALVFVLCATIVLILLYALISN